ncbi:MAG: hypothetical protein JWO82_1569 [Akkermansiaceae bacterium]|nr:hypothetical protein [Akkermansiaceae bacterium]
MMRGLLVLLLSALTLQGAQSPSEAALGYLRGIAAGKAGGDLSKDTAISGDITEDRLDEIREGRSRLKTALGGSGFTVFSEKEDGDLAAVLVTRDAGPDAQGLDLLAVGLIRRGERWLPAPLPGTFDNTGLNFEPELLPRARALEDWMIRSRSQALIGLKESAQKLWLDSVRRAVPAELLREGTPEALVTALFDAFSRGEQRAVYALLGGADDVPPKDWDQITAVVRNVFAEGRKAPESWSMLLKPQVLRAIVSVETGHAQASVAVVCQDPGPDRPQRPRGLHFTVMKGASGFWHVELPELLMVAMEDIGQAAALARESARADADLVAQFPAKLREKYPATPLANAEAVAKALVESFREPTLEKSLPFLDLSAGEEAAQAIIGRAVTLWGGLHAPGDRRSLILLSFLAEGDEACGIYQFFSAATSADPQLIRIYLKRGEPGWLAAPFTANQTVPASEAFAARISAAMEPLAKDWAAGRFTMVKAPLPAEGPSGQEAKEIMARWIAARESADAGAILRLAAAVDDEAGAKAVVRNLGYEMDERSKGEIGEVYRDGAWTCVAVKNLSEPPTFGLYPVIQTPTGPKVLLELYIRASEGRAADYLNRRILTRAAEAFPGDARDKLESSVRKYRSTLSAPEPQPEH